MMMFDKTVPMYSRRSTFVSCSRCSWSTNSSFESIFKLFVSAAQLLSGAEASPVSNRRCPWPICNDGDQYWDEYWAAAYVWRLIVWIHIASYELFTEQHFQGHFIVIIEYPPSNSSALRQVLRFAPSIVGCRVEVAPILFLLFHSAEGDFGWRMRIVPGRLPLAVIQERTDRFRIIVPRREPFTRASLYIIVAFVYLCCNAMRSKMLELFESISEILNDFLHDLFLLLQFLSLTSVHLRCQPNNFDWNRARFSVHNPQLKATKHWTPSTWTVRSKPILPPEWCFRR